ncbi:ferredoxin-type protein NapF [Marilutibacter alkalisoli]|uniref:Ferredoxin-type protein NapF n=1 Tax=Marilutibacter alkalisoli TaxID=2591633 RepID=A0A514BRU4_9GAMM|nr:ferredoxin-type protein NapF [Lysobacter alkalisoli]QDH70035.1 ferredoxin-type protein NapF [Lysobacter alkalisoli]
MPAAHDPARRRLLLGRPGEPAPLRPPWALGETAFIDTCTGCNACVERCPQQVLVRADGGYPAFDPHRGECTFCGECVDSCRTGAIARHAGAPAWSLRAHVDAGCLARQGVVCASCADACPERAIAFRPALPVSTPAVDTARCTGCGACVNSCPVDAMELLPEAGRA